MYIDSSRSKFRLRFKGRSFRDQQPSRIPEIIFLNRRIHTVDRAALWRMKGEAKGENERFRVTYATICLRLYVMQLRNLHFTDNPWQISTACAPSFDLVPLLSSIFVPIRAALPSSCHTWNKRHPGAHRPSLRTCITHGGVQCLLLRAVQLHRFLRSSVLYPSCACVACSSR